MTTNKKMCNKSLIILTLIILPAIFSNAVSYAQITDQVVNFKTPKVSLSFHPSIKHGINTKHPIKYEIPRLNMVINIFENYLQYLNKLNKISTGTSIILDFSPGQSSDALNYTGEVIKIQELGLNSLLKTINNYLNTDSYTNKAFLFNEAKSLFTIPDKYERLDSTAVTSLKLENLSDSLGSLEPESEFCIISSSTFVTTRPYRTNNRIALIHSKSRNLKGKILLKEGIRPYSNLMISANKKYLAFTEGEIPKIINIESGAVTDIFKNKNDVLILRMSWSPKLNILAGMVLDRSTQERSLFLFDATSDKRLSFAENSKKIDSNYQYANILWAPDGKKFILTSGKVINLIDIEKKAINKAITLIPNRISELIWSADSNSFAVVEIVGQTRSKYIFDDLDFRKSILHSFHISADGKNAIEDQAQRAESRYTIKLVSYWTLGRILYLQGRLITKKLSTPIWDLTKTFRARLTPTPSISISRDKAQQISQTEAVELPMKYLYVFKNISAKYKNIYDSGFAHTNHVFISDIRNYWFIGLRKPSDIPNQIETFNLRQAPYPFTEFNKMYFHDIPSNKLKEFLKFFKEYDLRNFKFTNDCSNIVFLSNFSGPLNLWSGNVSGIIAERNGDNEKDVSDKEDGDYEDSDDDDSFDEFSGDDE